MSCSKKSFSHIFTHDIPFVFLLLASTTVYAQQSMPLTLKGAAETPPVTTAATGSATINVLADRSISGNIKVSGINPTVAHIHEGAIGKSGPPIITLNKTANDNFVVPTGAVLTEAQYKTYLSGNLYVNVHSAEYPAGEIRVQLMHMEKLAMPIRPAY